MISCPRHIFMTEFQKPSADPGGKKNTTCSSCEFTIRSGFKLNGISEVQKQAAKRLKKGKLQKKGTGLMQPI